MGHLDTESTQALFYLTEVIPAPRNQVAFVLRQSKYNTFSYLSHTTMYMLFFNSVLRLAIVFFSLRLLVRTQNVDMFHHLNALTFECKRSSCD